MKIGIDARELARGTSTGIGRYVRTLLAAARARKTEHAFTLYGDARTDFAGLDWAAARRLRAPWPFADQVELPRLLARDGVELFFSPYYKAPLRCPCPYVVTIHDVMFMQVGGLVARSLERALAARLASRAAGVLTVSAHSKGEIAGHLGIPAERITVIPNAVPEGFGPVEPARRDAVLSGLGLRAGFVLYVGGFKASKNVGALAEAHRGLPGAVRSAHPLVLAGPDDEDRRRLAARFPEARWIARATDAQLQALYAGCALCVVPSLFEGFGMPALEAMACGAAVLVSNRASLPEVVGDAGKLVEPRPDALRAAMSALLEDEPALESLRRRGLERAGRYAPAAIGERLFAFLRGVR